MLLLSVLCFSPLVIPQGIYAPLLWGMPLSLWAGIAISIGMLLCTCLAAYACEKSEEGGQQL